MPAKRLIKSKNLFRVLKGSVEGCLASLCKKHATIVSFPEPEFTSCILLIALRILEFRGHLHKVIPGESKLTPWNAFEALCQLYAITNAACPPDIRIDAAPRLDINLADALLHLSTNAEDLWDEDLTIGYAYQFLCMAARKSAQAHIQTANKELSKVDLIAFTQLYTPRWVVDFLLANTLLPRLKSEKTLPEFERWRIFSDHTPMARSATLPELNVLDPACGAGNFLVRALDLVVRLYAQEGDTYEESISMAQANNIFGADIDHAALWVTALALVVKSFQYCGKPPKHAFNLSLLSQSSASKNLDEQIGENNLLGSLSRSLPKTHILNRSFAVVLTNPPYIGRKLMSRQLKSEIKQNYPNSHNDICAAFVERSLELLKDGGRFGVITQASILTLPSYGDLRLLMLKHFKLNMGVDAGSGVFPLQGGDKVNSALLVLENNKSTDADRTLFFDVRLESNKEKSLLRQIQCLNQGLPGPTYFRHDQSAFLGEYQNAIKYACPSVVLKLCRQAPSLADVADVRQGLATTDNQRFVRPIATVEQQEIGSIWKPYIKGAGADRWYSPIKYVVLWANGGEAIKNAVSTAYPYLNGNTKWVVKNEQFYFRSGLCFSFVNTGSLAVRRLPEGCIFDVGASALFVNNKEDEDYLLAYLNSSLVAAIATSMNPTINFQVGDIKRLPIFPFTDDEKSELGRIARECCILTEQVHALKSASLLASAGPGASGNKVGCNNNEQRIELNASISALEHQNNQIVLHALRKNFNLTPEEFKEIVGWVSARPARS